MAILVVAASTLSPAAHAGNLSMEDKVALQSTMFRHIEKSMIDGVVPHVVLKDGSMVDLVPTKAHPMILKFGDIYVLCTDFRDPEGRFVNVDFYITKRGGEYAIFQTEIDNRTPLKKLMKSGKVSMVE